MNPFEWNREHQLALGVAALIGAILGAMVSYSVAYPEASRVTTPFAWWLSHYALAGWGWIFFGALLGAGWVYVRQLLRSKN
jgi:hypothetical protein